MTTVRCAIYTRKSSEEGLEQSFNSLDAQREACEAYIKSQKHEGWTVLAQKYDDGGFSGGNIERPALKRLLEEVDAGRVDTIVVYKVDRLTRSLADFAKIVEKLDQQRVSFVSVTQQFNTTTSMGRLTLNVLLSFAQFEREVTGERIRDKIAASKRKGMWMGGVVPLGYDLQDRHLIPNPIEAAQVRQIFEAYLQQRCVSNLQLHLEKIGLTSKRRLSKTGNATGGKAFSRGALYLLLQNRIYLGEITHKDASYPGQHEAIVDQALWDKVREQLRSNLQSDARSSGPGQSRFLTGKLFDADGIPFTPTHTIKRGRRYHYYVSKIMAKSGSSHAAGRMRIPAEKLERLILDEINSLLTNPHKLMNLLQDTPSGPMLPQLLELLRSHVVADASPLQEIVQKVVAGAGVVGVHISTKLFLAHVGAKTLSDELSEDAWILRIPTQRKQHGKELQLVLPSSNTSAGVEASSALARAIARAHSWLDYVTTGRAPNARALAKETGYDERYVGRILPLAFLAPDITEAILDGRASGGMSLTDCPADLPSLWEHQRQALNTHSI